MNKDKLINWLEEEEKGWSKRLKYCSDDLEALSIVHICKTLKERIKQGDFD